MSTLYELTGEYLMALETLEDSEMDGDSITEALEAIATISDSIEIKAENYAKIIRHLEMTSGVLEAEERRLRERRKVLEANATRLKDNLQQAMIATGKRKFQTDLFSFNIQKNGGTLPVIVDVDVDKLPDELVVVTEKPDLKAIAKYIEETGDITYAHFGERGESLRIK